MPMGFNYVDDGSLIPNFSQSAEKNHTTPKPTNQPTNKNPNPQKRKTYPKQPKENQNKTHKPLQTPQFSPLLLHTLCRPTQNN